MIRGVGQRDCDFVPFSPESESGDGSSTHFRNELRTVPRLSPPLFYYSYFLVTNLAIT